LGSGMPAVWRWPVQLEVAVSDSIHDVTAIVTGGHQTLQARRNGV
jgi:hypothetical protein